MKLFQLPASIIAIVFITGCGQAGTPYNASNSSEKSITFPYTKDSTKSIFSNVEKTPGATAVPQMFPSTSGSAGGLATLNPAHGQPGHRCEIAVGAPLPATQQVQQPAPTAQTSPILATPTAPATPAAKTAGLNPAHGQPGHRCDIAVGAPLNSPVKQVGQPAATAQSTPVPTAAAASAVKSGLNPAHGQPGHRCDIAVGASLSSPVKKVEPTVAPPAQMFPSLPKTDSSASGGN